MDKIGGEDGSGWRIGWIVLEGRKDSSEGGWIRLEGRMDGDRWEGGSCRKKGRISMEGRLDQVGRQHGSCWGVNGSG
jgi:hypothetical protein